MAGAAQQQGQPVATDPKKATDGQIYKGDAKGDGHDDFQKAREATNAKLRQKQEADAKAEQEKVADGQRKAKIEGQAKAIVDGIDLTQIANEVDQDFKLAEKFRAFRTMTPENQAKLEAIKKNVTARRNKRVEELLNDPDMNGNIDNALAADAKKNPPAQPPQQPQGGAAQQPAGQQAPAEGTPPATVATNPPPAQPPQQMDLAAQLDDKLKKMRTEFDDKIKKRDNELEQERLRRKEAENKLKEREQAEQKRVQQETRKNFDTNAKQLGVPEDMLDIAFQRAVEVVNANQRQMTWNEIFAAMKEGTPSLFRGGKAATGDGKQPPANPEAGAGGTGAPPQKKVSVKAGTGTDAGGAGGKNPPETKTKGDGHESFGEARKRLSERVSEMTANKP